MDCSPPGSSVPGILQVRILECIAMPSSGGSSQPRDWTRVSHIAGGFFTVWATREADWLTHDSCPHKAQKSVRGKNINNTKHLHLTHESAQNTMTEKHRGNTMRTQRGKVFSSPKMLGSHVLWVLGSISGFSGMSSWVRWHSLPAGHYQTQDNHWLGWVN